MAIRYLVSNVTQFPIAQAAESALADLLVDSQIVDEMEAWDDGFSTHRRAITYHTIEPHIVALLRWQGTVNNDAALYLQLPPALASIGKNDLEPISQYRHLASDDPNRGSPRKLYI